jgi:dihydrofolate synthase/folylpolyglutamate synthase
MNRIEAENYVYASYMRAAENLDYEAKDACKRNPALSRAIIRSRCATPCVVVTGSKGKGSVACMVSQILRTKLDVGLMTSPHIANFCERFRVNGVQMSDEAFVDHLERIRPEFDTVQAKLSPSEFVSPIAIQTALALDYFNAQATQFNVFECGKGAEYDDANNVLHDYAIINTIFAEHTRELGATIADIARDKAHTITGEQRCAYIAEQSDEAMVEITHRAIEQGVPLKVYGRDFWSENVRYTRSGMRFDVVVGGVRYEDILIPLLGEHQAKNCALAMALCVDVLGELDIEAVKQNLSTMSWPGRMEILSAEPFVMLDACINAASTEAVKQTLDFLGIERYAVVVGIPDDKGYADVVRSMSEKASRVILTKSQNPHYLFTHRQREVLLKEGIDAVLTSSVEEAITLAVADGGAAVVLGTTSVVSEVECFFAAKRV